MAPRHHIIPRLLAAAFLLTLALAQTLTASVVMTGVHIQRPGVRFAVSGRQPAGSRFSVTSEGRYTAPVGFVPPVNATVARAVLDAVKMRDPDVDETTRTSEARRSAVKLMVPILCDPGQYGVLTWAPTYYLAKGQLVPGGDPFEVWFLMANLPGDNGAGSGVYDVECYN